MSKKEIATTTKESDVGVDMNFADSMSRIDVLECLTDGFKKKMFRAEAIKYHRGKCHRNNLTKLQSGAQATVEQKTDLPLEGSLDDDL